MKKVIFGTVYFNGLSWHASQEIYHTRAEAARECRRINRNLSGLNHFVFRAVVPNKRKRP